MSRIRMRNLISRIAVPASRVASFIVNPMKRLLREPLIHFLLLGAFLFAADAICSQLRRRRRRSRFN